MEISDVERFHMNRKGDAIICRTTNVEAGQVLNADKVDGVEYRVRFL
jgi:hypothetical protein